MRLICLVEKIYTNHKIREAAYNERHWLENINVISLAYLVSHLNVNSVSKETVKLINKSTLFHPGNVRWSWPGLSSHGGILMVPGLCKGLPPWEQQVHAIYAQSPLISLISLSKSNHMMCRPRHFPFQHQALPLPLAKALAVASCETRLLLLLRRRYNVYGSYSWLHGG